MSEWTVLPRKVRTPNGVIHYGGPCRDDYRNMRTYDQGGGNTILTLQGPAMEAFKDAEVYYAKALGWSSQRILSNDGLGRAIQVLPGTNRSCSTQARLYADDPSRYASPNVTGHTRGLAIDVSQAQPNLAKVNAALLKAGWTRTRPTEEPWHFSYGVTI